MSFLPIPSFDIRNVPVKFVSITAFHPFRGISLAREGNWPPPLLIKKSILSWSLIIEATVFLKFHNYINGLCNKLMSDSLNIYPCSIQNSTLHPLLFECCIVEKKYCLMETMFVQLVSISLYHGRQSQLYSLKEYSTNGI